MKQTDSKTAIIVGAGLSGICMAVTLKELGVDFIILEKTSDIAGTWSQNIYPGCGCDTPMFAYCYSFELFEGDAWPKQPEILEYFRHCVKKYKLDSHIRYQSTVSDASYDDAVGNWHVGLEDGTQFNSKFLINATGQLNNPFMPKLNGMENFTGKLAHSAEYCTDFDARDKTVGIVGNGATTLQIVEALQPQVKELFVFARSPKYVYPRVKYSPITLNRMKKDPEFWQQVRQQFIDSQDQYRMLLDDFPQFDPFNKGSDVKHFYSQSTANDFDEFDRFYEWLIEKDMRPDYPTGCTRPLASNSFHQAIQQPNVSLIGESIEKLSEHSIVSTEKEYPVDLLIMATGFSLNNLIPPYSITGTNHLKLSEAWKRSPETYLGMATADFPNLFFLYGPNTNTNSTAVTFYVESQVNYIRQVMQEYINQPFESIEIKSDVLQNYTKWLSEKNVEASENSACSSYYQNEAHINISTFPGCFREYESMTKTFLSSEYRISHSSADLSTQAKLEPSHVEVSEKLVLLFSDTTQLAKTEIQLETELREFPLDSILIVDFIKRINEHWKLRLEPTAFFEHASLKELSETIILKLKESNLSNKQIENPNSNTVAKTNWSLGLNDDYQQEKTNSFNLDLSRGKAQIPQISEQQVNAWRNRTATKGTPETDTKIEGTYTKRQSIDSQIQDTDKINVDDDPIAIIGAHGYFPQSKGVDEYWNNLIQGKNCITQVPSDRWHWEDYYGDQTDGDKTKVKWGGFIENVDLFDPLFFKMSPKEAELMDPQHRLFLQCTWELIESAGYNPHSLSGQKIGVILGINLNDYSELVTQASTNYDVLQMSGLMHLFGANRISYLFGFTGPSEVIDTACSSSLIAIHRAIQSIRQDDCEMMIAGGSNLILSPKMHLLYSKAGMLSEDGKCKTFSSRADGYVRGEGVAAVLLKKQSLAIKSGDTILGIIRGSAENHGGKANSLTAPNPKLQAKLIEDAMLSAKVDPRSIGYIECHGTGTALGDPIEINGIRKAYESLYRHYDLPQTSIAHCGLGSVKSNIGHLETTAGIAGVIKVLLCFEHQQLPQSLNSSPTNSQIHLENSPFYLVEEKKQWDSISIEGNIQPRRAGISSFGAGGSNAHIILEESQSAFEVLPSKVEPVAITLSAATKEQLMIVAEELLLWMNTKVEASAEARNKGVAQEIDLVGMAYTLQVGREPMQERVGLIVNSVSQLREMLSSFLANEKSIKGLYQDSVINNRAAVTLFSNDEDLQDTLEKWIHHRKLPQLVELWAKGLNVDWNKLYPNNQPRRMRLPTYPFALQRCWIDTSTINSSIESAKNVKSLHPLLHRNISDFNQQKYSSTFTGREFFLDDHRVNQKKVLPAVAYLEMIRSAIEQSLHSSDVSFVLELHNSVWTMPVIVEQSKEVVVSLVPTTNDEISFEVFSYDGENKSSHFQGGATFQNLPILKNVDINELKSQMINDRFDSPAIYHALDKMGLDYGPSHKAIETIYLGNKQLLAKLKLPTTIKSSELDYWLHPSLVDGALQACNGLIADFNAPPSKPLLPFALDSLRILAPCTNELFAWIRYTQDSQLNDKLKRLDIDLFDSKGNICIQMKGFSSRMLSNGLDVAKSNDTEIGLLMATPVWKESPLVIERNESVINKNESIIEENKNENEYQKRLILLCDLPDIDAQILESKIPRSQCSHFGMKKRNIADSYSEYAISCFESLKAIIKEKPKGKVFVQIVIANSLSANVLSGLSGLLKTASLENPNLKGQILILDDKSSNEDQIIKMTNDELLSHNSLVKYEENLRFEASWLELEVDSNEETTLFKEHGVYLITGGLGGLGILFTKEILFQSPNARIIVTGRTEITQKQQLLIESLSSHSAQIIYRKLDLTSLKQVEDLITSIQKDYRGLSGILHCAGMISDNFILKKTAEEFAKVLEPKILGNYHLDIASQDIALDFIVMFSSVTSAVGYVGQSDYASANGFMDQFSEYRNQLVSEGKRRGKTLSINWPYWEDGGITLDENGVRLLRSSTGMLPLNTSVGMQAFYKCLGSQFNQVIVMQGELNQIRSLLYPESKIELPLLPKREHRQVTVVSKTSELENSNLEPSQTLNSESFEEKTLDYIRKQFSVSLKLPAHQIDTLAPLENYGIDSILAMSLTSQLEKTFGSLPKTLFFEYQTIKEIAQYFAESFVETLEEIFDEVFDETTSQTSTNANVSKTVLNQTKTDSNQTNSRVAPQIGNRLALKSNTNQSNFGKASTQLSSAEPIAIVGLSGRYPESDNIEQYWLNLRDGKDCIVEVPKDRWNWEEYYDTDRTTTGLHFSKWGGFISGVDEFDARFFNISPKEAAVIDPQERLFLQHSWMAMEDAGYTRASLQIAQDSDLAGQVGVYVGVMYGEYQLFGAEASLQGNRMGISSSVASISNRVSYVLNLHGPSMTLDTMCSSSFTAIHLACQDLKLGRTSLAVAGGVNVSVHPNKYLMLSAGQFISSDGHCQSFGEGGDGYIPGEGVGVVILKRLSEAEEDGNSIYGILKGSTLNHGGKTNGFTVPNPIAQADAVARAIKESGVEPRHISYIEAHGTGTKLGDPIEIAALTKAFNLHTKDKAFCSIGSAKSNIGHCESAAGIAGLTKVLLQMKYQQIVPSLHSTTLNPHIDFPRTPFVVNQKLKVWERPVVDGQQRPLIAGISSFGAGGANAHVIVEEYVADKAVEQTQLDSQMNTRVIIPLSARKEEQLKQKVVDLLEFIRSPKEILVSEINLLNVAFTLQVGREPMDERLAFEVSSVAQLEERLNSYLSGDKNIEDFYQGKVKSNKESMSIIGQDEDMLEAVDKWIARKKLSKIADMWVKGLLLDWRKLYEGVKTTLISLPTYPFAQQRYWIDTFTNANASSSYNSLAKIHPLLHTNTSDLKYQSYSTRFSGTEFFLREHVLTEQLASVGANSNVDRNTNKTQKSLAPVTYFEMARAALQQATPQSDEPTCLTLLNMVWTQPLVVENETQVSIALLPSENEDDYEQIDFEIYSESLGEETIHCQGQATITQHEAPSPLNITQLRSLTPQKVSAINHHHIDFGSITAIQRSDSQLIAELNLPPSLETEKDLYQIHPHIMESSLNAASELFENEKGYGFSHVAPFAIESVKVFLSCTKAMFAWVRFSQASTVGKDIEEKDIESKLPKLDLDICDQQGNVAIEIRGIKFKYSNTKNAHNAKNTKNTKNTNNTKIIQDTKASRDSQVIQHTKTILSLPIAQSGGKVQNETVKNKSISEAINLDILSSAIIKQQFEPRTEFSKPQGLSLASLKEIDSNKNDVALDVVFSKLENKNKVLKPIGISLAKPAMLSTGRAISVNKQALNNEVKLLAPQKHQLAPLDENSERQQPSLIKVFNKGDGTYSVQLSNAANHNSLSSELIDEFLQVLKKAQEYSDIKVLMISGEESPFLSGGRAEFNNAVEKDLFNAIANFPYPTVALLPGGTKGVGFLIAALCDYMICSQGGTYGYTNYEQELFPLIDEKMFFECRFGEARAYEFLYNSTASTGQQLQDKGWTFPIVPTSKVEAYAYQLATTLVAMPQLSLRLLKQHLARNLLALAQKLRRVDYNASDVLPAKGTKKIVSPSKFIHLESSSPNVLTIKIKQKKQKHSLEQFAKDFSKIITNINQSLNVEKKANKKSYAPYKVILLVSECSEFLPHSISKVNDDDFENSFANSIENSFENIQQSLLSSVLPVIAAIDSSVKNLTWLTSLFCDTCFYDKDGAYSIEQENFKAKSAPQHSMMLQQHLGEDLGKEVLLTGAIYTGSQLLQHSPTLNVTASSQVYSSALKLAKVWSQFSLATLVTWKQEKSLSLKNKIKNLPVWSEIEEKDSKSLHKSPKPIVLNSEVVSAIAYPEGTIVVKMEDRQAKNMFSDAIVDGMNEVFLHIEQDSTYKVVVLTGYDSYFASGGTKETLLAIQEGKTKFTDRKVFQLALDCRLPVIAAMQGHGIGAGWAMGMFADIILMSEESHYVSPYMNYGFTPGAGSTYVFPNKIGYDLTRETLLTAQEFSGQELKRKGLTINVQPRKVVLDSALEMAKKLTNLSRSRLIAYKHQWTQPLMQGLSDAYVLELEMHEQTFVGHVDTLSQIESNFSSEEADNLLSNEEPNLKEKIELKEKVELGEKNESNEKLNAESVRLSPNVTQSKSSNSAKGAASIQYISAVLKALLADELHMDVADVEEDVEFIELGLDSITGVTWVRNINERYSMSIEATKVYSYPTLAEFSHFIQQELLKQELLKQDCGENVVTTNDLGEKLPTQTVKEISGDSNQRATSEVLTFEKVTSATTIKKSVTTRISILEKIRALLADELYMDVSEVDEDAQFIDLGLDSITGVTWIRKINEEYKISIEATKVYSYPTLNELSHYVEEMIPLEASAIDDIDAATSQAEITQVKTSEVEYGEVESSEVESSEVERSEAALVNNQVSIEPLKYQSSSRNLESQDNEVDVHNSSDKLVSLRNRAQLRLKSNSPAKIQTQPIAIIGMSGQFPKAKNLNEFWDNIAQAKSCVTEVPIARWDTGLYFHAEDEVISGKSNSKWMGALEEFDRFDPLFFNISPIEAESMDPQQRLFLENCWNSIENSGYNAQSLSGTKCGVFVGVGTGDYQQFSEAQQLSAQGFTGNASSILAARISYFLNLQGPCLSIDTACSSSLVAIANACESLNSFSSDIALAGGVFIMTSPAMHIKAAQAGMLSKDGQCFTFDQRANGFVPGEGVGVILLKRLSEAKKDRDIIHGVIEAWGINQDGKSNGITAPNAKSQAQLLNNTYKKFGVEPAEIQLVEAHGTGTKLGDPIEVEGLKSAFEQYTKESQYCALGSVKSNIGHCIAAAGISGVLKLLLAIKHQQLPPTINYNQLNEHINLKDSPFYINTELKDWKVQSTKKRQAAISSFGFSGTNAHLVISEYVDKTQTAQPVSVVDHDSNLIVVLSAKTKEQLRQRVKDLSILVQSSISNTSNNISLVDLAYTLQAGREAMDERLGLLVSSLSDLSDKLQNYLNGNNSGHTLYTGQVQNDKKDIKIINQDGDMRELIIDKWIETRMLSKLLALWVKGLDFDWNKLYEEVKPNRISLPSYPFSKERFWIETDNPVKSNKIEFSHSKLHPLLHVNDSNLSQQSYYSIFSGEELFLRDHQVSFASQSAKKVLPGVAYIEMARAALENAIPKSQGHDVVEFNNFVWSSPIVVENTLRVNIDVSVNDNGNIDFQVYSASDSRSDSSSDSSSESTLKSNSELFINETSVEPSSRTIHGQGQAQTSPNQALRTLDIEKLKTQMMIGRVEPNNIYSKFEQMGLNYGVAHRGIDSLLLGESQLLANLSLPQDIGDDIENYYLHPCLMDSALQASFGLIESIGKEFSSPWLPFALDSIRIASPCTENMVAWLRYSDNSNPGDRVIKLDIDLCDQSGQVCVEMRGFSMRELGSLEQSQTTLIVEDEKKTVENNMPFDDAFYQKVIESVLENKISVDEAVELG